MKYSLLVLLISIGTFCFTQESLIKELDNFTTKSEKLTYLKSYAKKHKKDSSAIRTVNYSYLSAAYNTIGEHNKALKYAELAIKDDESNAVAWAEKGHSLADNVQFHEAIISYSKSLELKPNYSYALTNRGHAYHQSKMYTEAIDDYTKAIQLQPDSTTYYQLAIALKKANKIDSSLSLYGFIYDNFKGYEDAIYGYGFLMVRKDLLHVKCAEVFEHLISLNQKNPAYHFYLGKAYYSLDQYALAASSYQKTIDLNTEDGQSYFNLGLCSFALGKDNESCAAFEKSLQLEYPGAKTKIDNYCSNDFDYTTYKSELDKYLFSTVESIDLKLIKTLYYDIDWHLTSKETASFIKNVYQINESHFLVRYFYDNSQIESSYVYKAKQGVNTDQIKWEFLWNNDSFEMVDKNIHWFKTGVINSINYLGGYTNEHLEEAISIPVNVIKK